MHGDQPLGEHFLAFAKTVEREGATTYPDICRAVADNDAVLALLDGAPLLQRRPVLLLAAVHFLLLSGDPHPLGAFYDTVRSMTGRPGPTPADGALPDTFVNFCATHRTELERLVTTRRTQTNEVGRCSALLPGLCSIALGYGGDDPLALLDLGTSAGLNLLFDDYGYTYRDVDGDVRRAGAPDASVIIECAARNDLSRLPDLHRPTLAARVGMDLSPLDPRVEDDARWLLACQWPDNPPRFDRLRTALATARASTHFPQLVRGDILSDLRSVTDAIEGDGPLVVFHSWVASYLTEDEQRSLARQVASLGAGRPVHHLYCESPYETPGLPTPPSPVPRQGPDLATALVHVPPGGEPVRLADTHPHGTWIRWWPSSPA